MIGIIKEEDQTLIELNPFFATKTPKWAKIRFKSNNNNFGEYGIAFSITNKCFWIMIGNHQYPGFVSLYIFLIKPMVKRIFK